MSGRRTTFDDLVAVMARLRAPGGCPWDREQTPRSLRPYLLEEAYETLEAIDADAPDRLCEELGDLLLQVVFHAEMAAETGAFTVDDVVACLVQKLIRRHPHVFGDAHAPDAASVLTRWETIKEAERAGAAASGAGNSAAADGGGHDGAPRDGGALGGLPRALPSLALAQRMQERAARVGFRWPSVRAATAKIREELAELERADASGPAEHVASEAGDFLFAVATLPRLLGLDGEQELRAACTRFRERFARMEAAVRAGGRLVSDCAPEELLAFWRAAR